MQGILKANKPTATKLYQVVSMEEFNQIMATNKFQTGAFSKGTFCRKSNRCSIVGK